MTMFPQIIFVITALSFSLALRRHGENNVHGNNYQRFEDPVARKFQERQFRGRYDELNDDMLDKIDDRERNYRRYRNDKIDGLDRGYEDLMQRNFEGRRSRERYPGQDEELLDRYQRRFDLPRHRHSGHNMDDFDQVLTDAQMKANKHGSAKASDIIQQLKKDSSDGQNKLARDDIDGNVDDTIDKNDKRTWDSGDYNGRKLKRGYHHVFPTFATFPKFPTLPVIPTIPVHPFSTNNTIEELFTLPENITDGNLFKQWLLKRKVAYQAKKIKQLHQLIIQLLYMDESLWSSFSSDESLNMDTGVNGTLNDMLRNWLYTQRLFYQKKKINQLQYLAVHLIQNDFASSLFK